MILDNTESLEVTPSLDEQDAILRTIISPLIVLQDPVTLLDAIDRFRASGYKWAKDCLMPDFQIWLDSLPNEQITWLGDDCVQLAPTLVEKGFPDLLARGMAVAIQSLGTDNPRILAEGIFEYAKSKMSRFEASLFAFGVIQLLRGDQFIFKS